MLALAAHALQLAKPGPALEKQPWGEKWQLPYRQEMYNWQNTQYSADFTIGPVTMRGIFDTGSFELLVLSEKCEHCSKTPYDAAQSKTYRKNGTIVQHVFGSGPCLSEKGYEQVVVGPLNAPEMTFYEIVQHEIPVFEGASFSAIVGLGDGPGEEDKSLLQKFNVNEFSICLEKESGAPGWLAWGGELKDEMRAQAIALPVLGQHHWAVHMTGLGFDGQTVTCQDGCGAILDSGTSLIAAPTQALMALSMVLPPIHEDCSNIDDLPDLAFMLNGQELVLPPEAYVLRLKGTVVEAQSVWDVLYFKPKVTKLDQCLPAFMQIDRTTQFGPLWILGMPFFRFFHSTFHINPEDREDRKVFITKAGAKCQPEKISSDVNEDYEAPSTNGTHSPNMLALQKDKQGLRGQQQVVRAVHRRNRPKQVPLEIDAANLLPPLVGDAKNVVL
jgi:hypothetical protein